MGGLLRNSQCFNKLRGTLDVLNYRPEELLIGMRRIAKVFDRPAESLISVFRSEADTLAALDAGLLAILLQIHSERNLIVPGQTLELAEICSARLHNLAFANDRWSSSEEWNSVSDYFGRLRRELDTFASQED